MRDIAIENKILELIKDHIIQDQEQLLELITKDGHQITQPTLSRYLKKLGIVKENGRYVARIFISWQQVIKKITPAPPNLIVVTTRPGYANTVAYELDQQNIEGVFGTLAGDDTVLVVTIQEKISVLVQELALRSGDHE